LMIRLASEYSEIGGTACTLGSTNSCE